ncbi:MAG: OsmC family protein [Acidimicrobiales bacterium]
MSSTTSPTADNGVNVEALLGARQALTDAPEAAKFIWRAECEWVKGTHSRTTVNSFFGLGQDHVRPMEHTIDGDHPEIFASEDKGSTPTEIVLAALASCLTAGVATVASNRGVKLRSVTATLEAGIDLRGILGIDSDVRNGFDGVTVTYKIDADASKADIEAIVAQSQKRSAVYDILVNPTAVRVVVA